MPQPTRRTALAGIAALAAVPAAGWAIPASEAAARIPLAESAILMAEDGTLTYIGMSERASLNAFISGSRWHSYRMACRSGYAELIAQTEQAALDKSEQLAGLLRAEGFGDTEIADYIERQRAREDEYPDFDPLGEPWRGRNEEARLG